MDCADVRALGQTYAAVYHTLTAGEEEGDAFGWHPVGQMVKGKRDMQSTKWRAALEKWVHAGIGKVLIRFEDALIHRASLDPTGGCVPTHGDDFL